jgi:hypothetical protein
MWKSGKLGQAAVGAEDGEVRGHAGGEEGGDPEIGLDADIERLHRAGLADRAPVAAGLGEALEHGVPEDAGLVAQAHRQRVAEIGRAVGRADPDERVAQQLLAAAPRVCSVVRQRSMVPFLSWSCRSIVTPATMKTRTSGQALSKLLQDGCDEGRDDVVRHAEADLAGEVRGGHGGPDLVVHGQEARRLGEQHAAARGERQPALVAVEQRPVEQLFQRLICWLTAAWVRCSWRLPSSCCRSRRRRRSCAKGWCRYCAAWLVASRWRWDG